MSIWSHINFIFQRKWVINLTCVTAMTIIISGPDFLTPVYRLSTTQRTELINITHEANYPNMVAKNTKPMDNGYITQTGFYSHIGPSNAEVAIPTTGNENISVRYPLFKDSALVTISGNAGKGGATMLYTGGGSTNADSSGNYIITIPYNWTGTITPSLNGFTFLPASRVYTTPVTTDLTGENYGATQLEYTLTVTSDHGMVTKSPNQALYHYGDIVHLTHTDNPGYKFDHWSDTITGSPLYPPGAVAISFDDGYLSTYTDLYPYMKSKGIPGTIYAICDWIDYQQIGFTHEQLQELDANGWSIGNHTVDHTELDTLTEVEQEAELRDCKNSLDSLGLTKASSHVAYPYGLWNTDTLTAMVNTGMLTGRGTDDLTFDPQTVYPLEIPSGSADTLDYVKQFTDEAVANHLIYIFHGHQIGESGDLSLADFKAWIDYLEANHIPTLTVNDVYARTFTPIDVTILGNTSVTANYTRSYTISGNTGIGGAVLNYSGGKTVSDTTGKYIITVRTGWTGTVTPSKLGYSFSPASHSYTNLSANIADQNFSATPPIIISGNAGVGGASLAYADGSPKTVTADQAGDYTITVPYSWSGTVTPSMPGYSFSPVSMDYALLTSNQTGQNYIALFNSPTPSRTQTKTKTATSTFTRTSTLTPTATFTPSNTPTKTGSATATFTSISTHTHTPTPTATFTPTFTAPPTNTASTTATFTPTPTQTSSPNATFTATPTRTPSPTATYSSTPTRTVTPTKTYTSTPTSTVTLTSTYTSTPTRTVTPTKTYTSTPTSTVTPTNTYTSTPTGTVTLTNTYTSTPTLTVSPTPTLIFRYKIWIPFIMQASWSNRITVVRVSPATSDNLSASLAVQKEQAR